MGTGGTRGTGGTEGQGGNKGATKEGRWSGQGSDIVYERDYHEICIKAKIWGLPPPRNSRAQK